MLNPSPRASGSSGFTAVSVLVPLDDDDDEDEEEEEDLVENEGAAAEEDADEEEEEEEGEEVMWQVSFASHCPSYADPDLISTGYCCRGWRC